MSLTSTSHRPEVHSPSPDTRGDRGPDVSGPAGIEFRGVTVRGHEDFVMLDHLDLRVERGEIVALLGPSGAGKTTALRAVAGFVQPSEGRIFLGGVDVTDRPTRDRGLGMVVQSYALFPHMTVAQNVAFGLRARGQDKAARATRVTEVLDLVGMGRFAERHPRQLSGGQQQRVAIARALAPNPDVMLLDEPLSALDAQLRQGMLTELARLHRELPDMTMLYVTHGQNEALTLADRIAVMSNSRLVEFGSSRRLFRDPRYEFTAKFLGSSNVIPVQTTSATEATVQADSSTRLLIAPTVQTVGTRTGLCVRPHHIALLAPGSHAENETTLVVEDVQWRGSTHSVTGRAYGQHLTVELLELQSPPAVGVALRIGFAARDAVLLQDAGEGAVAAGVEGS